jgi:putative FmdB family regulatory protein
VPIYEYLCGACAHEFEAFLRKPTDGVSCPACQSANLERVLSRPRVHSEARKGRGQTARQVAGPRGRIHSKAVRVEPRRLALWWAWSPTRPPGPAPVRWPRIPGTVVVLARARPRRGKRGSVALWPRLAEPTDAGRGRRPLRSPGSWVSPGSGHVQGTPDLRCSTPSTRPGSRRDGRPQRAHPVRARRSDIRDRRLVRSVNAGPGGGLRGGESVRGGPT